MDSQLGSPNAAIKPRLTSAFKQLWSMHWVMAACYLLLFLGGTLMVRLPEDMAARDPAYTLHKSMGALTMALLSWRILILLRVWWRKYTRRSPKLTGEWIRVVLFHASLYLFMLAVPVSGFFLSNSYKSANVNFFWIATLPDLFPENEAVLDLAKSLHFWLAYTFLAFVGLHAIDQWKFVRATGRRIRSAIKAKLLSN